MNQLEFAHEFRALTENDPFPWQGALYARFMASDIPRSCDLPTGLGKTSVIPIWLIALANQARGVPRRLVYVVDRRAVVDQATDVAIGLRESLAWMPTEGKLTNKMTLRTPRRYASSC